MKIKIAAVVVSVILGAHAARAQMPESRYTWQQPDTLEIAYKQILKNDNYASQTLSLNKKRILGTAMMIGFGALTYYFHHQAESSYSSYLDSGSISQMNAHFKRTEKYDRLKGLSSIGIQVGFLLNVWSFF